MTEVRHDALEKHLEQEAEKGFSPVFLFFGEELLVKEAYRKVLHALLPDAESSLNFELFDGSETALADVVERVNTYSMLAGTKVVALIEARLFASSQDRSALLEKARRATEADDLKAAARHLASAMALDGLDWKDLQGKERDRLLGVKDPGSEDSGWLDPLVRFCIDRGVGIPKDRDEETLLQQAVEKGFPKGNHLLITIDKADRRKSLYSSFREHGTVVDCSVPSGERRADRLAQESVMRERIDRILAEAKKGIEPAAAALLQEMTGFDLRSLSSGLEKLIDFAGERNRISVQDVVQVLDRTKKDPIFEFTNALAERDLDRSLFFLDSLLSSGVLTHPLQLLAAMVNQVRKLLRAKAFVVGPQGKAWSPKLSFSAFQARVLPGLQQQDEELMTQVEGWREKILHGGPQDGPEEGGAKKKAKFKSDLRLAPNPKNAYPAYQLLRQSDGFSLQELSGAMSVLARADVQIKTGAGNPRLVLETVVMKVCGGLQDRSGRLSPPEGPR